MLQRSVHHRPCQWWRQGRIEVGERLSWRPGHGDSPEPQCRRKRHRLVNPHPGRVKTVLTSKPTPALYRQIPLQCCRYAASIPTTLP